MQLVHAAVIYTFQNALFAVVPYDQIPHVFTDVLCQKRRNDIRHTRHEHEWRYVAPVESMRNIKTDGEQFFILPNRFPDPIEFSFSGDGCQIKLLVERVANNSINVKKFKTQKDHAFQVVFTVEHLEDKDISRTELHSR